MRNYIILAAAVLLLAGTASAAQGQPFQVIENDVDSINQELEEIAQNIFSLNQTVTNNTQRIDYFFDIAFTLNDTIHELQNQHLALVQQHANDTQRLDGRIDALNLTCHDKTAQLQAQIDSLEERLEALENSTSVGGQGNESQECTDGETRACGSDVGACTQGTETCTDGAWGLCTGATGPTSETCNGIDDDCDGEVDELDTAKQCKEEEACKSPTTQCDGTCVDLSTDNNNCGACGNACLSGETCTLGVCTSTATDADEDGYTSDVDCDDTNPSINPGATEVCNDIDDDCDGTIDEDNVCESDPESGDLAGTTSAHNDERSLVGVASLEYNTTLASTAQAWADNCNFSHNPDRGFLGENIYAATGDATGPDAVAAWAAEKTCYDASTNTCDTSSCTTCGHYTQVVWNETTDLGCGLAACTDGALPGDWTMIVCNYAPPGNVNGEAPY